MVFSSYVFIFAFLPAALLGFYICSKLGPTAAKAWLCIASIVFYGYWYVGWIPVLIISVVFNFVIGNAIRTAPTRPRRTLFLVVGITGNLAALAYYKYLYAVFSFLNVASFTGLEIHPIALPLGISFFTFTQIAYLVDTSQGYAKEYSPLNYLLFVTFFPHLIAGPIIHHRDLMPQFEQAKNYRLQTDQLAIGLTIFVIGLLKKSVIADRMGFFAGSFLDQGGPQDITAAWIGMLAYSMQLYFDFSGYSDMAIGLARIFGIKFPLNFNSPYKAINIIDYWQRWHMTLTRFLTGYIFNPITLYVARRRAAAGKVTSAKAARTPSGFFSMIAMPMMITMVLAGVWHGAGLQFVIFGVLHGFYLTINHAWRAWSPKRAASEARAGNALFGRLPWGVALTYLGVLVAQVFFWAPSVESATGVLGAMMGFHGFAPSQDFLAVFGIFTGYIKPAAYVAVAMIFVWTAPNTQEIMASIEPALGLPRTLKPSRLQWRMTMPWAVTTGALFLFAALNITPDQPFIYFQF